MCGCTICCSVEALYTGCMPQWISTAFFCIAIFSASSYAWAQDNLTLEQRARQYLIDLLRIDTSSPPGNETRAAEYLKKTTAAYGISSELLGGDPSRLNFVARLRGDGSKGRPLLLMAHTDVVPVDRGQWTVEPFAGLVRDGYIYGRGAQDDKCFLAAELAVFVELKRRNVNLGRDVIFLAESGEEGTSDVGVRWMIRNAYDEINAEFALNEGGFNAKLPSGVQLFHIQTSEKVPTRVVLTAHGSAGHGSIPRPDNPVAHLARALDRLVSTDESVQLNETTRRYFRAIAKTDDYKWLEPLLAGLENPKTAVAAANQIRAKNAELDAALRTTLSPTMLKAGFRVNVIPNTAEAQIDVRRLPTETREEVYNRFRRIMNDPSIDISPAGLDRPATEPSSMSTALYKTMESVFQKAHPRALVIPYMQHGATDGADLRAKGMAVYGVPLFDESENRLHGNDERIGVANFEKGAGLLWQIVTAVAGQ